VLTLSDWYHEQVLPLANIYLDPLQNPTGGEPVPYSALMNDGHNVKLNVKPGKTYFIRIINMAAFSQSYLHFDQHKMTIVEIDGIYTEHKEVDSLYIAVAQRYGVLLKTKHTTSTNYAALAMLDSTKFDNVPTYLNTNVTGYLVYDDKKALPLDLVVNSFDIIDDFTLTPYDKLHLFDGTPDSEIVVALDFFERDGQNR
jgi:iron transport multicopper oxidase